MNSTVEGVRAGDSDQGRFPHTSDTHCDDDAGAGAGAGHHDMDDDDDGDGDEHTRRLALSPFNLLTRSLPSHCHHLDLSYHQRSST